MYYVGVKGERFAGIESARVNGSLSHKTRRTSRVYGLGIRYQDFIVWIAQYSHGSPAAQGKADNGCCRSLKIITQAEDSRGGAEVSHYEP